MLSVSSSAMQHRHYSRGRDKGLMEPVEKKRIVNNAKGALPTESLPSMTTSTYPSSSCKTMSDDESCVENSTKLPEQIITSSIIRPIPKRISEQFYDEAYKNGLTLFETNQAAALAHDWHRKWTHQDEKYHTMPGTNFYRFTTAPVPSTYYNEGLSYVNGSTDEASDCDMDNEDENAANGILIGFEREEGAKNPSLGSPSENDLKAQTMPIKNHNTPQKRCLEVLNSDGKQHFEGKIMVSPTITLSFPDSPLSDSTTHQGFIDSSESIGNSLKGSSERDFSNRGVKSFDCNEKVLEIQRPLPVRPDLVKPLALRVNPVEYAPSKPAFVNLSPAVCDNRKANPGRIPFDIITKPANRLEPLSPMSFATGSSLMSSKSSIPELTIGLINSKTEQDDRHMVEDERLIFDPKKEQTISISLINDIETARDEVLHVLAITDGDVDCKDFKEKVEPLEKSFKERDIDTRNVCNCQVRDEFVSSTSMVSNSVDGMWLTLSKPNYFGKLGQNDDGDPMYTLGRMSFDMFSPTNLVCSLQGNFNQVNLVTEEERKDMLQLVPKKLRDEVENSNSTLRTYNVVTAFTIEPSMAAYPNAPNKDVIRPIKGIMTTYGYCLPDPDTPNRHSIWFTGGRIEPNNNMTDVQAWKDFFALHPPKHTFGEKAKLLAVKLLMGATIPKEVDPEDGSMNYVFTRPLGGHGMAYVDVVYLDDSLRIVRGQRGTTFVFSRVPEVQKHHHHQSIGSSSQ